MRRHCVLAGGISLVVLLAACAPGMVGAGGAGGAPTSAVTPVPSETVDDAAQRQAQAWLDGAVVPPGAVRAAENLGFFLSYQGWPCQPVVQLEGYWTLDDWTVASTVNWLRENPTGDLVSTAVGPPMEEGTNVDGGVVGYIPADESQQGIVYTVIKKEAGVVIRAEIAALSASAECPEGTLGKPGQG